jgi:hypothetical protein
MRETAILCRSRRAISIRTHIDPEKCAYMKIMSNYPLNAGVFPDGGLGFETLDRPGTNIPKTSQETTSPASGAAGGHPFEEEKIPIRRDANKIFLYACNPLFSHFFHLGKTTSPYRSSASDGLFWRGANHGQSGTESSGLTRATQRFSMIIKQKQDVEYLAHAMLTAS